MTVYYQLTLSPGILTIDRWELIGGLYSAQQDRYFIKYIIIMHDRSGLEHFNTIHYIGKMYCNMFIIIVRICFTNYNIVSSDFDLYFTYEF